MDVGFDKWKDDLIQFLADEIDGTTRDIEICRFIGLVHSMDYMLKYIEMCDAELYNNAIDNLLDNTGIYLKKET